MGLFGKKKQAKPSSRDDNVRSFFDEESEILPRGFEPVEVKPWKYFLIRFSARWGGLLSVLAIFLTTYSLANPPEPPEPPAPPALSTEGKPVANRAVAEWLSSDPQPVPGGHILSWDGAEDIKMPSPITEDMSDQEKAEAKRSFTLELHNFTVIDGNNMLYTVSVQVADDESAGPQVVGEPSLLPDALSSSNFQMDETWPGYKRANLPANVDTAVDSWAKAFTSGRPDDLRQAVGDPNADHTYTPLYRVTEFEATIGDSATISKSKAILRLDLTLRWEGQAISEESKESVVSYDLLISGVNSASPRVTSWGAPGTGPDLEDYSVALVGRDTSNDEDPAETDDEEADDATGSTDPGESASDPGDGSADKDKGNAHGDENDKDE